MGSCFNPFSLPKSGDVVFVLTLKVISEIPFGLKQGNGFSSLNSVKFIYSGLCQIGDD